MQLLLRLLRLGHSPLAWHAPIPSLTPLSLFFVDDKRDFNAATVARCSNLSGQLALQRDGLRTEPLADRAPAALGVVFDSGGSSGHTPLAGHGQGAGAE
jgi:hypothetical protein